MARIMFSDGLLQFWALIQWVRFVVSLLVGYSINMLWNYTTVWVIYHLVVIFIWFYVEKSTWNFAVGLRIMYGGIFVSRYLEAQWISQFVPVHACSMVQMVMVFEDMGSVWWMYWFLQHVKRMSLRVRTSTVFRRRTDVMVLTTVKMAVMSATVVRIQI